MYFHVHVSDDYQNKRSVDASKNYVKNMILETF